MDSAKGDEKGDGEVFSTDKRAVSCQAKDGQYDSAD